MLEGDLYRKLILVDGNPPDAKLQKKIDAEIEKERAAAVPILSKPDATR